MLKNNNTNGEKMETDKGDGESTAGFQWNFPNGNAIGNPFGMMRTPPRKTQTPAESPKKTTKETPKTNGQEGLKERMNSLMEKINELTTFVDAKNNVHAQIKTMLRAIKVAASAATDEARRRKWGVASTCTGVPAATQTDVWKPEKPESPLIQWQTPIMKKIPPRTATTEKRRRERDETAKDRTPKQKKIEAEGEAQPKKTRGPSGPRAPQGKKDAGKKLPRRSRPDAIVVEKTGGKSYADILRMMKSDPKLEGVGEKVTRIKKNQKGQLMLELKREENGGSEGIREAVSNVLENIATVKVLTQEMTIVCKDMEETTTKEEMLGALQKEFGWSSLPETAIKSMRPSFGGTQIAVLKLPFEQAKKALEIGRVRIGWTMCKLREVKRTSQCFRCLDFGHMAKDCKNEDRSKKCRRCGEEGHFARSCRNSPRCMLCKNGDEPMQHVTGSSRCLRYTSTEKPPKT